MEEGHELVDEPSRILGDAKNCSIQEDKESGWGTKLSSGHQIHVCIQQKQNHTTQTIEEKGPKKGKNSKKEVPSTPRLKEISIIGPSSSSVVIWVIRARFFTRPHASPSGVSEGHNIPN